MKESTPSDRSILSTLCVLMFASASQVMIVAPLLATIGSELEVDTAKLGNLMTVYAAMVGAFALVAGPVSDRVGRRKILLYGSALMAVSLGLHGIAWNYASLLCFRALSGVAGGILSGSTVAFAGDYFPEGRRGWANGWIMSGMAAGQVLGVPAGTLIGAAFGYQLPFLFFAAVMVIGTACVWIFIPQLPSNTEPLSLTRVFRVYGSLMTNRATLAATLIYLGIFFGIACLMAYLPAWLEESIGFSTAMIALLYCVGGTGTVLAGPRAGALSDRIGRLTVVGWSTAGVMILMLLMPLAAPKTMLVLFPVFLGVNVFFAARAAAFQALLTENVGAGERGSFMSLTAASGQLGFASGAAIAGPTFVAVGFWGNAILAAAASLVAAGIAWKFIPDSGCNYSHEQCNCPSNKLQIQTGLCGPTPELGHMASSLQPPKD